MRASLAVRDKASAGRSTSFVAYWKVPENAGEIEVEYSYRENFTDKMVKIKLQ